MTETQIQQVLWNRLGNNSSELLVPNYTTEMWWEMDLFRMHASGYVHEYEIKTSIVDFRNDFKKEQVMAERRGRGRKTIRHQVNKHDELRDGKNKICVRPNRFTFVVPEDILDNVEGEIPEYAGLIYVRQWGKRQIFGKVVKKAPLIHKEKRGSVEDLKSKLFDKFYFRYWQERQRRA